MKQLLLCLTLAFSSNVFAQSQVNIVDVPSPSLMDVPVSSETRPAYIYLPASYQEASDKTYPVVYVLHGFGANASAWFSAADKQPDVIESMDKLIAQGEVQDMIIVVPDTKSRNLASWYQTSEITGDWRTFILQDLSDYVEATYRTNGKQAIIGHSMGGYGALNLATYEQFDAVGVMSPAFDLLYQVPEALQSESTDYFNSEIYPLFSGFDGSDESIGYYAHLDMSLIQLVAPDEQNAPSYIADQLIPEDFQTFNQLTLEYAITERGEILADSAVRFEMGKQEGEEYADMVNGLNQMLVNKGVSSEFHQHEGDHTSMIYQSLEDNLIFVSDVMVQ